MTTLIEEYLLYDKIRCVELIADPLFSNLNTSILTSLIKNEWDTMNADERAAFRQSILESTGCQLAAGSTSASNHNQSPSVNIATVTPPKPVPSPSPFLDPNPDMDDRDDNDSVKSFVSGRRKKRAKLTPLAETKVQVKSKSRGTAKMIARRMSQQQVTSTFKPGEWVWITNSRSKYNGCPAQIKECVRPIGGYIGCRLLVFYQMSPDSDNLVSSMAQISNTCLLPAIEADVCELLGLLLQ
jgi:hypothetical protein